MGTGLKPHQVKVVETAALHRGWIITSYAQVEFLLVDLVLRCRDKRGASDGPLPYSLDSRIKAARDAVNDDERFIPYRPDLEHLIEGLKPYRQIRDMMAHGMLIVRTHKTHWHELQYRMFRKAKGGQIESGLMNTSVEQLENAAREIADFSNRFVKLWHRMYLDLDLEPVC